MKYMFRKSDGANMHMTLGTYKASGQREIERTKRFLENKDLPPKRRENLTNHLSDMIEFQTDAHINGHYIIVEETA